MIQRIVLAVVIAIGVTPSWLAAQDRFSRFQERLERRWDDLRPKGKFLQQLRDGLRSEDDPSDRGSKKDETGDVEQSSRRDARQSLTPPITLPQLSPDGPLTGNPGWPRARQSNSGNRGDAASAPSRTDSRTDHRSQRSSQQNRTERDNDQRSTANRTRANDARRGASARSGAPQPALESAPTSESPSSSGVSLGVIVDEKSKGDADGLRILKVTRKSPADNAGLRSGDILLSIAGVETTQVEILDELLAAFGTNDQVQIEYLRGKKPAKTLVSFGNEPVATDEPSTAVGDGVFDDATLAPMPPVVPGIDGPYPLERPDAGLHSVLSDRATRQRATDPRRANASGKRQLNEYYPSPDVLPPITGSAIAPQPGSSILRGAAPANRDTTIFRPLPPLDAPSEQIDPAATAPDDGGEPLEIELLSPDGR